MDRRTFFGAAGSCLIFDQAIRNLTTRPPENWSENSRVPISHSVIPILGDGKWIWRDPPEDETGYLEPREFEVTTGIEFTGKGNAGQIQATTVAPVEFPEQQIKSLKVETSGCDAKVVKLGDSAAQFAVSVPTVSKNQRIIAKATYRMQLFKDFRGYSKESFPKNQTPTSGKIKRASQFRKEYFTSSPGIKLQSSAVKKTLRSLGDNADHPWDQAKRFYDWVWNHIKGIPGKYTSVEDAIKKGRGDCEERAAVFIALCRCSGIPARLVWVPGHNWAEIGLYDYDGKAHWIPIHTAAYSWFGWTGAHEVVLQKGDRIQPIHQKKPLRLIDDWYRLRGVTPEIRFTSSVKPVSNEDSEAGPGAREKQPNGRWKSTDLASYRSQVRGG